MRNVWDMFPEKSKTHILCSIICFRISCCLCDNAHNYCIARRATGGSITIPYCMLHKEGYRHALRIYNTLCFSSATKFAATRLSVTLLVHCLPSCVVYSCCIWQLCKLKWIELNYQYIPGTIININHLHYDVCTLSASLFLTLFCLLSFVVCYMDVFFSYIQSCSCNWPYGCCACTLVRMNFFEVLL